MGASTENHAIIRDASGPILVYNEKPSLLAQLFNMPANTQLKSRPTINAELSETSELFGVFSEAIKSERVRELLTKAADFTFKDSITTTLENKLASVMGGTLAEMQNRVLVITPTMAKDLTNYVGSN